MIVGLKIILKPDNEIHESKKVYHYDEKIFTIKCGMNVKLPWYMYDVVNSKFETTKLIKSKLS